MLTQRDVELTNQVVKDLLAQGDRERATAVENVLAAASTTVVSPKHSGDLLSVGRAAQALGVTPAVVKKWIVAGELPATRRGSRTLIFRRDLLAYLDRVRDAQKAISAQPQADPDKIAAERAFVLAGMPIELQERLHALMEKLEDGGLLSADEEAELDRLEDETAWISAERLREWTHRRRLAARKQKMPVTPATRELGFAGLFIQHCLGIKWPGVEANEL